MEITALTIPTLADPKDILQVKVINPDVWPAPPADTELLVSIRRQIHVIFPAWSFWVPHNFYPSYRISSLLGAEFVQQAVDRLAAEYDVLRAGPSQARVLSS